MDHNTKGRSLAESKEPFCVQITNGGGPPQRIFPGRGFTVGIYMLGDNTTLVETLRVKGAISIDGVLSLTVVETTPPVVSSQTEAVYTTDPYFEATGRIDYAGV